MKKTLLTGLLSTGLTLAFPAQAHAENWDQVPAPNPPAGPTHDHGNAPRHPMVSSALLVDQLEAGHTRRGGHGAAYDLHAFIGTDTDRLWFKAEGKTARGRIQDSRTEVLWGHAVAPYWDSLLGLRHDAGQGMPDRDWLAFGIQGLAPWWFEVDAMAYLGADGRSALRLGARHDLLITQQLILQPKLETNFYGKSDPAREIGRGLAELTAGLRLRYEITRQFAPYIGVEWSNKFGTTADYAREAGEAPRETRYVAGIRFWF